VYEEDVPTVPVWLGVGLNVAVAALAAAAWTVLQFA
jgi:hypothetical protein